MDYTLSSIPISKIQDNGKNFYSIDGIAELAENIRTVGLLHPVRVVRVDGDLYRCVDGHRRLNAYRMLDEESEGFSSIPAYEIPVTDDLEEQTMLLMANANNRQMTTADLHRQEAELRQLLEARRAAGRKVPKNLSQYMASVLGCSRNEVSRMHTTNTQLIPEAKQLLQDGKLNASAAYEMARKPEVEQRAAVAAFVPPEVIDYQRPASERMKNLIRLAGKYVSKYMPESLKLRLASAVYRKDVIDAFKEVGKAAFGHASDGLRYGFTSTHIDIADSGASVNATIVELSDAAMVATLRAFAGKQLRDEATEKPAAVSKMDTGWKTGHPDAPCWCICRIWEEGMSSGIYSRVWWGGQKWNIQPDSYADSVTHWIAAPEETD